jgi:hypothetical protein
MGTLSYGYGKPYGYKGERGTCRWCGDKLRFIRLVADALDQGNPTYREEPGGYATIQASRPGGYADGLFCTLRCGYQWAVRNLRGR